MMKYFTLKNLGWIFTALCSFMFIMGGYSKVTSTEQMVQTFTSFNLLPYLNVVGVSEIIGVLLLIYPRTSIYGALVLSSIMSGAAVLHLSYLDGKDIVLPIVLGVFAWTGHCLRAYNLGK